MSTQKKVRTLTPPQYAFLKWLYERHPNIAKAAEEQHASLSGFMDTLSNVFNQVMDKAPDLMKQYVTGRQQIEELKANIERAKAGQYPLEPGFMSQAPSQNSMLPTLLLVGAGGLVVYLLLKR